MSKIRLGEPPFFSVQGEGNRAGVLSVWIRFFGCNLRCPGFYTEDPTDEKNVDYQLALIDPKKYKSVIDLPVVQQGCDSLYSIDPRFKHLATDYSSAEDLYERGIAKFLHANGSWEHPVTKNDIDLCFTGGEPMLQQSAMVEIMNVCAEKDLSKVNRGRERGPIYIQIETNGTKPLQDVFIDHYEHGSYLLNWNISPKLFNVSGERDAVNVENIKSYFDLSPLGHLKFVITDSGVAWNELNETVKKIREAGVNFPVYVMPVGATREQQSNIDIIGKIATRALNEGYHVSGRLHTIFWGNTVGT